MGDPRNVAHAKKVSQEKHHKGDDAPSHQPGKKAQPAKKSARKKAGRKKAATKVAKTVAAEAAAQ